MLTYPLISTLFAMFAYVAIVTKWPKRTRIALFVAIHPGLRLDHEERHH